MKTNPVEDMRIVYPVNDLRDGAQRKKTDKIFLKNGDV